MSKRDEWTDESTNEIDVHLLPLSMEQRPALLEMVSGPGAPRTLEIFADEMVLGRAVDAAIPISASDLSRRHLVLKRVGPQVTLTDLGSRNGIYLNGVKVHAAVLHEGDNIQLGTVMFVFHEGRGGTLPDEGTGSAAIPVRPLPSDEAGLATEVPTPSSPTPIKPPPKRPGKGRGNKR